MNKKKFKEAVRFAKLTLQCVQMGDEVEDMAKNVKQAQDYLEQAMVEYTKGKEVKK